MERELRVILGQEEPGAPPPPEAPPAYLKNKRVTRQPLETIRLPMVPKKEPSQDPEEQASPEPSSENGASRVSLQLS